MGINCWVLYYDLLEWNPKKGIMGEPLEFPIQSFSLFNNKNTYNSDCLLVVESDRLQELYFDYSENYIVCVGEPGEEVLNREFRGFWISDKIELKNVVSRLATIFIEYQNWMHKLEVMSLKGNELKEFGEISLPLLREPISFFYYNFYTLFWVYDEKYGRLPEDYETYVSNSYVPEDIMISVEMGSSLKEAVSQTKPYVFHSMDDFRCLCYNLRIAGKHIATLQLDELNHMISERDEALIYILGERMAQAMVRNNLVNLSLESALQDQIYDILEDRKVSTSFFDKALRKMGWGITDTYSCIVCETLNSSIPETAMFVNGEAFIKIIPKSIYLIWKDRILIFCNRDDNDNLSYRAALKKLRDKLVTTNYIAGISNDFRGFEKLRQFYHVAKQTITYGASNHPGKYLYYYETYMLEMYREENLKDTVADIFIPSELLYLMKYDRERGSDYCKVLKGLLRNNMSATETAAELFMHRNTVINRATRLRERFNMNLSSYEYRLKLMIAFQVLEGVTLEPM